ncbi:phiSA1p31-related protein [Streptomyces cyaneofuscatus]
MTEFKVGDKAIRHGSEVEITYGPFTSPLGFIWYVVGVGGGKEDTARKGDLSAIPHVFAVGDKVRYEGVLAEIIGGPVPGADSGEEIVLFKYLEGPNAGKGYGRKAWKLEPVTEPALVPVGTRVRVDRATHAGGTHGRKGVIESNTETFREANDDLHRYYVRLVSGDSVFAAEVTPVDDEPADGFEYEGVTYKYGVPYTDCDGDTWTFERPTRAGAAPKSDSSSYRIGESLVYVVDNYRPLTTD